MEVTSLVISAFVRTSGLLLLCHFCEARGRAQTAEITFYSNASVAKMALNYGKGAAYYGFIFDGSSNMMLLQHGQFGTFTLPAGIHHFSGSQSRKHASPENELVLDMAPGQHYFVATSETFVNLVLTQIRSILEQVDCSTMLKKASSTHAAPLKHVAKEYAGRFKADESVLACSP